MRLPLTGAARTDLGGAPTDERRGRRGCRSRRLPPVGCVCTGGDLAPLARALVSAIRAPTMSLRSVAGCDVDRDNEHEETREGKPAPIGLSRRPEELAVLIRSHNTS